MRKLKITQVRSVIGSTQRKKRTIEAIGLRKINHSVVHKDTQNIRGMIKKVKELVAVDEVKEK
ncbi:50S ribosomal protein L30 [candidate division WOR-3 bacterium]|nr:50S ribosomal protein L30 [candidate division WOR-3 bacterium]